MRSATPEGDDLPAQSAKMAAFSVSGKEGLMTIMGFEAVRPASEIGGRRNAHWNLNGDQRFNSPLRLAAALFASLLLLGCSHVALNSSYSGPKPLPAEIKDRYAYPKGAGPVSERVLKRTKRYTVRRIEFPSTYNILSMKNNITIDYYDIHPMGRAPVVMVLPILGGGNGIARSFAQSFAENGYAAVLVHRQEEYKKLNSLNLLNPTLEQIVIDHRQAIDWIETRPELDAGRIGVFGISMGGIKGALLDAIEERVAASVLVMAGGDIPYILTKSNEDTIAKRRKALMRAEKITAGELYNQLSSMITADPLRLAEYIDARKILLILARYDEVVPFKKGEELRHKIGNPETIYLLSGHYSAALYIPYVEYKSLRFFDRQLVRKQKGLSSKTREAHLNPAPKGEEKPAAAHPSATVPASGVTH
jgi:hypothetical protein